MKNINLAISHLKTDPILAPVIEKFGTINYPPPADVFVSLAESIISQQLSGKAADTIWGRFAKLFPKEQVTAQGIVEIAPEQIRAAGASWAKAKSLKDLSEKVLNGSLQLNKLEELTDDQIIEELVKVKGIGRWTAEMRLMFSFERSDVLPLDDRGIQNAYIKLYNLNNYSTDELKKTMLSIASTWRPYRTVACWYLWKYLDNR